jgi:hypothetical protein
MAKAKVDKKFMAAVLGMATLGAGLFGYGGYKRFGAFNKPAQASAPQQAPQRPMAAKPAPAKPATAKPQAAPQAQPAPVQQTAAYEFSHPSIEKFLGGIAKAEHRGNKNIDHTQYDPRLMIRTKAGGGTSSAYGPYQLTKGLVKGLVNNHPEKFAPIKDFTDKFIQQGSAFLKSKTNHPQFGLGQEGTLSGEEHHNLHMQLGDLAIQGLAKEKKINYKDGMTPNELNIMIRTWRGASEKEDPEYYKIVRGHYFSN